MATNYHDRSTRNKRPPKNLSDFVCDNAQTNEQFPCERCEELFPDKKGLTQHLKLCTIVPEKGKSFFGIQPKSARNTRSYNLDDKILPPSQPLSQSPQSNAHHTTTSNKTPKPTKNNKRTSTTAESSQATSPKSYAAAAAGTPQHADNSPRRPEIQPESTRTASSQQPLRRENGEIPQYTNAIQTERMEPLLPKFDEIPRIPTKPYNGVDGPTFARNIDDIYEKAIKFRKNQFLLPTGQCGKVRNTVHQTVHRMAQSLQQ